MMSKSRTNDTEITTPRLQRKELSKTLSIDRTNDIVYSATTKVVKAIMSLSRCVDKAASIQYLDLVRDVGIELRTLLSSVDVLANTFPPPALKYDLISICNIMFRPIFKYSVHYTIYREVEMAHKVLAKDMSDLVSTMRLAQQYSETTLDVEYRK